MSPYLFNVYMDAVMKSENGDWRRGEWRLPGLLYAGELVLKVKVNKSKVMVLDGEEGERSM